MLKYPSISKQGVSETIAKFASPYRQLFGISEKKQAVVIDNFKPAVVLPTQNISEKGGDLKLLNGKGISIIIPASNLKTFLKIVYGSGIYQKWK